jgi:hypothetical protein
MDFEERELACSFMSVCLSVRVLACLSAPTAREIRSVSARCSFANALKIHLYGMPNRRVNFEGRIWPIHKISDYTLMSYFSGKCLMAQSLCVRSFCDHIFATYNNPSLELKSYVILLGTRLQ